MTLVLEVEKKYDWIIDNSCLHHMTSDMNKFVNFKSQNGGIVRVGNNATHQVKGIGSITLDDKIGFVETKEKSPKKLALVSCRLRRNLIG